MKRFTMLAALWLLSVLPPDPTPPVARCAWAAETPPAPAPLLIIPPIGDVLVGDDVDMATQGLTVGDLVPGKVFFLPPESSAARCKLVVQWGTTGLEPVITFRANRAGTYRMTLVKALPAEQLTAATVVVTVKGEGPAPDPTPGPTPGPNPPAKPKCLVIEEQSQRTAAQAVVLSSQKVRAAFSGGFVVEDKDVKDKTGKTPAGLQPYIDVAVKAGLPYVFVFGDDGKVWKEAKLPATVDAMLGLLKEGK